MKYLCEPVRISYKYFWLLLLTFFMAACSPYQKVLKSIDSDYKYKKGKEYYGKGKYYKALPIFEELIPIFKGSKDIDELYYMYAMCHYEEGNLLIAAFHFKNIHDSYPQSPYAEECLYMNAFCHYEMSPRISLDQTYTEKGLNAFQLYINSYPNSDKIAECNVLMDKLRRKLEVKSFKAGELYFKIGHYSAAAVSFENTLKQYPDTEDAEEIQYYIAKSYYLYARNSIAVKQSERYGQAVKASRQFLSKYKESGYTKEIEEIQTAANDNLEQLKNKN